MHLKVKSYLKIIIFNLTVVAFLFLLFEFCIRLFIPEIKLAGTSANLFVDSVYNSTSGLEPNTTGYSSDVLKTTNQFRCWKYKRPVSKMSKKILTLGDSVTMGIGVTNDSTFPGILNSIDDTVDILCPALIGYSSFDYLNIADYFLSEKVKGISINEVQIYWTLNDLYSNFPDKNGPSVAPDNFFFKLVYHLRRNSKAYIFIKNLFSDRSKAYFDYDNQFYLKDNPILQSAINHLKEVSIKCQSKRIALTVFILPYEYQIRNYYKINIFKAQEIFLTSLKDSPFQVIDCSTAFKDHYKSSNKYYLWGDGIHFSEEGHKLIANFVKNYFKK